MATHAKSQIKTTVVIAARPRLRDQCRFRIHSQFRTKEIDSTTKESHPDLVVLDMYLDNPSGARVLSDLRDNGYEGAVIAMSGPSKLVRDEHSRRLHRIVQLPAQIGTRFDLGELETAVNGVSQIVRQ